MSLARNDMLTTGDNRAPRARRSCYVDEPAHGFFTAGSSLKGLNGVYIRRHPPATPGGAEPVLYYAHMDSAWTMQLVQRDGGEEDEPRGSYGF